MLFQVGGQGTRPTFFEMSAAQQLPSSLRAALTYSLGVCIVSSVSAPLPSQILFSSCRISFVTILVFFDKLNKLMVFAYLRWG